MPRRRKFKRVAEYVTNRHDGVKLPWEWSAVTANPQWYARNCCPQCGRVNGSGKICESTTVEGCPLVTCFGMHDKGHYLLGTKCPAVQG